MLLLSWLLPTRHRGFARVSVLNSRRLWLLALTFLGPSLREKVEVVELDVDCVSCVILVHLEHVLLLVLEVALVFVVVDFLFFLVGLFLEVHPLQIVLDVAQFEISNGVCLLHLI